MKKIALWKMILLSIVTLGFYELYWVITQRQPLMKKTKIPIHSIKWPIAYFATVFVVTVVSTVISILVSDITTLFITLGIAMLLLILSTIARIWWMWSFLKAAERIVQPRVTFGWLIVHLILVSVSVIFIVQYYANKKKTPKQTRPTRRFVVLSIVSIVVIQVIIPIVIVVLSLVPVLSEIVPPVIDSPELQSLNKATYVLDKEYKGCVHQLDIDYPYVTADNQEKYLVAYDDCEAARIKQNKAVEDYNALYKKLESQ